MYKKELGYYNKFITENNIESKFKKFKEKEIVQKKLQIKKTKSIELEL